MKELNVNPYSILLEHSGRNTAPAITLASLKVTEDGEDPILIILPSEHYIKDDNLFLESLNR